jgi:hypothetical protein
MVNPTEAKVRFLDHNRRIDKVNRTAWSYPMPQRQNRSSGLAAVLRSVMTCLVGLRNSIGLGTRMRKGGARGVA